MPFQQRRQQQSDEGRLNHFGQRTVREQWDQLRQKFWVLGGLNHHGQLHGWLAHFYSSFGIGVQRAIYDVGPAHQLGDWLRIEPKTLLGDCGDETGAGLEIRIVEFSAALILLEMRCILRRKERALVVIEPPGNLRRAGILEIHDGVFVAIKIGFVEKSPRAVQQA